MKTITLYKGTPQQLILGPLLAATMRDHSEGIKLARAGKLEPMEMLDLTCTLAAACCRRVDPSFTKAQAEEIVDMENFGHVFSACFGVSIPEQQPGEAMPGESPPS